MKINITLPSSYLNERKYTFDVLLAYFKEVNYSFVEHDETFYEISDNRGNAIKIEDHFWDQLDENQPINSQYKVPETTSECTFQIYGQDFSLRTIFGINRVDQDEKQLTLSADLIASAFFMLTRWEETISEERDEHDRFPDSSALAVREQFHQRPVVNEYIEFFRYIFSKWNGAPVSYNRQYEPLITHDVDEITRAAPFFKHVRILGADLIRRRSISEFFRSLKKGIEVAINPENDDSWTFERFMKTSENHHLTSHFYFIPGKKGEEDYRYSIDHKHTLKAIDFIQKSGHIVGIHPSYRVKNKASYFTEEKRRLENVCNHQIDEGRHHYLRVNLPHTLRFWEQNKMKFDSSIGYSKHIGFRAGMCYPYPFFDIFERRQLQLVEHPLILMDVALFNQTRKVEDMKQKIKTLSDQVRQYEGEFVFLWHNNNIHHPNWREIGKDYEDFIAIIAQGFQHS
ncbi:MAG: polysaccharide deacetylase family protein [Bacteroidota bacterium]